ncbi:MAG: hypothetical protein ABIA37_04340, partial [Candidatus Woesearchaeota archaeon]
EIAAAGFDNGKYYFIDSYPATDDLYEVTFNVDGTIDTTTKIADISNNTHKWTFSGDIAVKDGIVYGWGLKSSTFEFFKVNVDGTGFTYTTPTYQESLQLAFGSDNVLYGHRSTQPVGQPAPWFVIDTTDGSVGDAISSPRMSFTDAASGGLCIPKTETAWGNGTRFVPKGNWGMYFNYNMSECYDECESEAQGSSLTGAAISDLQGENTWLGLISIISVVALAIVAINGLQSRNNTKRRR